MKNCLAIDTSCHYLTVVAVKNGQAFSTFLPDCAMKHSVSIMGAIDETLQKANLDLKDCDFFASVVGAGSFTGIRIGISVIKGFCLAYKKPSLPVTSFDVASYNAIDTDKKKKLCLVDAMHDCYYVCGYEGEEVVLPPTYLAEEEILALADEYALVACADLPIGEKVSVAVVDPVEGLKNAARALGEKNAFGDLEALYVRKSSAELNRVGKQ